MNTSANEINQQTRIKTWIEEGLDNETIILNFRKEGLEESQLNELQVHIKRLYTIRLNTYWILRIYSYI
jgi:hypothetical protein